MSVEICLLIFGWISEASPVTLNVIDLQQVEKSLKGINKPFCVVMEIAVTTHIGLLGPLKALPNA